MDIDNLEDKLKLSLFPSKSSCIFLKENNTSNYFNFFESEQNDLSDEENNNEEVDPEEHFKNEFNKVFPSPDADNGGDLLCEIPPKTEEIDNFIIHLQKKLEPYYFNGNINEIMKILEKRFPSFFDKTQELLYFLKKLQFFQLLSDQKLIEAKKFFNDVLLGLIKEVKKEQWQKKTEFFLRLLDKPQLVLKDFFKKYYDKFTFEIENAIHIFLNEGIINHNEENDEEHFNNNPFKFQISSELDFQKKIDNDKINDNIPFETRDNKEMDNKNNNEIDISNLSTNEDFSDFEDEMIPKLCNEETNKSNQPNDNDNACFDSPTNQIIEKKNEEDPVAGNCFRQCSYINSKKSSINSKENELLEEEEDIIDTSTKHAKKKLQEYLVFDEEYKNIINLNTNLNTSSNTKSNYNYSRTNTKKKKINKSNNIIFNQLPFLSSFKPKYIKRETIDKGVIRTFKNYIVKEYKEKRFEINSETMDTNFFINFVNGNLLPPIDFFDVNTEEHIKFNSFNCNYLLWLFSKKGVKDTYLNYINEKGKDFINNLSKRYEMSTEEKNQLSYYINNFPFIFDISLINNMSEGLTVHHLYRSVKQNQEQTRERKKNMKKKNFGINGKNSEGDSAINGRERSRSRENDDANSAV